MVQWDDHMILAMKVMPLKCRDLDPSVNSLDPSHGEITTGILEIT